MLFSWSRKEGEGKGECFGWVVVTERKGVP